MELHPGQGKLFVGADLNCLPLLVVCLSSSWFCRAAPLPGRDCTPSTPRSTAWHGGYVTESQLHTDGGDCWIQTCAGALAIGDTWTHGMAAHTCVRALEAPQLSAYPRFVVGLAAPHQHSGIGTPLYTLYSLRGISTGRFDWPPRAFPLDDHRVLGS